jgi:hypothetical protein
VSPSGVAAEYLVGLAGFAPCPASLGSRIITDNRGLVSRPNNPSVRVYCDGDGRADRQVARELARALAAVEDYRELILTEWNRVHDNP